MYDDNGEHVSFQGRRATDDPKGGKTRNPRGYSIAPFFADALGLRVLSGDADGIAAALIVEGMTDYLRAAQAASDEGLDVAVIGCVEGSFRALANVQSIRRIPIYIGTDADLKGRIYAEQVAQALPGGTLYSIPLDEGTDLCDAMANGTTLRTILASGGVR